MGPWGRALVGLCGALMVLLGGAGYLLLRRAPRGPVQGRRAWSRAHGVVGRWTLWFHAVTGGDGCGAGPGGGAAALVGAHGDGGEVGDGRSRGERAVADFARCGGGAGRGGAAGGGGAVGSGGGWGGVGVSRPRVAVDGAGRERGGRVDAGRGPARCVGRAERGARAEGVRRARSAALWLLRRGLGQRRGGWHPARVVLPGHDPRGARRVGCGAVAQARASTRGWSPGRPRGRWGCRQSLDQSWGAGAACGSTPRGGVGMVRARWPTPSQQPPKTTR
jgi:hypothetical protein